MTFDYQRITRNIAECKRLLSLTEYQRINERAADHHADAWLAYRPLKKAQLTDKPEEDGTITLNVGVFGQFVALRRPTEIGALREAVNGHTPPLAENDKRPLMCLRWCIYCKDRHPMSAFIHHKRYLHHYSYACKTSLKVMKRRRWHLS